MSSSPSKHLQKLRMLKPLLPVREWVRIESYILDDRGLGTDAFGTARAGIALAYTLGYFLHRYYFRVVSSGHDHIPARGAAVVVGNHSGVLPFDGIMVATDIFRHTDPPRLVRYMVDYFVYQMPFLGLFFRSLGQIPGTRRNFDGLIEEGHLIGVFPEGAQALGKPASKRYQLDAFSHGHVELAARHRVPVVPFGLVGAEEQQTVLGNMRGLAKFMQMPYFPITTTFPWLGPLGILPRPSQYFIVYGEPLTIDPQALHSVRVRQHEVQRVHDAVNDLLQIAMRNRAESRRQP